jgi:hypothetical protein
MLSHGKALLPAYAHTMQKVSQSARKTINLLRPETLVFPRKTAPSGPKRLIIFRPWKSAMNDER